MLYSKENSKILMLKMWNINLHNFQIKLWLELQFFWKYDSKGFINPMVNTNSYIAIL